VVEVLQGEEDFLMVEVLQGEEDFLVVEVFTLWARGHFGEEPDPNSLPVLLAPSGLFFLTWKIMVLNMHMMNFKLHSMFAIKYDLL